MNNDTECHVSPYVSILAEMSENLPFDMRAQRILKSAGASALSDQSLPCLHEDILLPSLSKMRPVTFLIRPRECVC